MMCFFEGKRGRARPTSYYGYGWMGGGGLARGMSVRWNNVYVS